MTMFILDRDFLQGIEDIIVETATVFEDDMVTALVNSRGLTYGDIELSRPERILKYIDDEQTGANERMRQIDPEESARRAQKFQSDMRQQGIA